MKKIILFCVNYDSYISLQKFLKSINVAFRNANHDFYLKVIVSDNSTKKKTIVGDYNYELMILDTGSNLGYFGGIEYGIKNSYENLLQFDYIIISNVDLTMNHDFFEKLLSLKINNEIGCIAPSIYSEFDKRDRNPKILTRPSRKKLLLQRTFYQFPILDFLYTKLLYAKRREKVQNYPSGYIYASHGSFMIFSNSFSGFLQTMDYPCFLFGEEIYLAEHLQQHELKTYYDPTLKIIDLDHVSTGKMKSKDYYRYNYNSIDMLLKEFFNE